MTNSDFGQVCDSPAMNSIPSEASDVVRRAPNASDVTASGVDNSGTTAIGRTPPARATVWSAAKWSDLRLLRHLKRVVHLDSEVANGALDLRVSKKQLHVAKIVRPPIDQRRFRSAHAVRSVGVLVQPDFGDPAMHNPGVLPR